MKGDRGAPVRLRFTKHGRVRFISHRDVARAFERAFRVLQSPLAFTEGFSPRPRISFGLALPTGYESEAEFLDVELTDEVDLEATAEEMTRALPEGMAVTGAVFLEPRATSLQQAVTAATYRAEAVPRASLEPGAGPETALDPADVRSWVQEALDAEHLMGTRRRKGKEVEEDLRPAIRALSVAGPTSKGVELEIEVLTQPRSVRPGEVLAALPAPGTPLTEGRVVRTDQWIERDGSRLTPLEAETRPRTEVGAP